MSTHFIKSLTKLFKSVCKISYPGKADLKIARFLRIAWLGHKISSNIGYTVQNRWETYYFRMYRSLISGLPKPDPLSDYQQSGFKNCGVFQKSKLRRTDQILLSIWSLFYFFLTNWSELLEKLTTFPDVQLKTWFSSFYNYFKSFALVWKLLFRHNSLWSRLFCPL